MITALCVAGAVLIGLVLVIGVLSWLKARAAKILDDDHARHD